MTNKKHTHKTISEGVSCGECISHAAEKSIEDQQELMDKHTPDIVGREKREERFCAEFRSGNFINERTGLQNPFRIESWWNVEIDKAYQQGYKDGEKKAFKYLEEFFETETQFDYDDLIAMKSNIKALKDK